MNECTNIQVITNLSIRGGDGHGPFSLKILHVCILMKVTVVQYHTPVTMTMFFFPNDEVFI